MSVLDNAFLPLAERGGGHHIAESPWYKMSSVPTALSEATVSSASVSHRRAAAFFSGASRLTPFSPLCACSQNSAAVPPTVSSHCRLLLSIREPPWPSFYGVDSTVTSPHDLLFLEQDCSHCPLLMHNRSELKPPRHLLPPRR
jgi:hypothetical protein